MTLRGKLAIPSLRRLTKRNEERVNPLPTERCECANVRSLLLRRSHHQDNRWILTTQPCLYQVSWIHLALLYFPFTKLRSYGRGSCSLVRHQLSKLVILVCSLPDYYKLETNIDSPVYDISILSGIPSSVCDIIPLEPLPTRLLPLFAVGVHDMSILAVGAPNQPSGSNNADDEMEYGWVANTTDDILALKPHLYDTVITMPPAYTKDAKEKHWPRLEVKKGIEIKATQRDLRRYRTFRRELRRSQFPPSAHTSRSPAPPSPNLENDQEIYDDASSTFDAPELVEPQSWSALAYNSFMWWASAGEKRTDVEEEEEYDASLLRNTGSSHSDRSPTRPRSSGRSPAMEFTTDHQQGLGLEMRIIAYFHRLTTLILKTLADIIDASDSDYEPPSSPTDPPPQTNHPSDEDRDTATSPLLQSSTPTPLPEEKTPIPITAEDMSRMGLDIWSESDRVFVKELVGLYWGRRADVRGGGLEWCGVRIC